jgi:eukaryotic-like serine/threonine-protein kinase
MRERSIFMEALDLSDPQEEQSHLRRACGDDEQLRARVEALLRSHRGAAEFVLDQTPAVDVSKSIGIFQQLEAPGTVIGPYKLLEQVGEGGMGAVYMAEQLSPVRRRVALKLIKPGMDTRQVLARFEAERQALALMDHPNIARVLDGGATDSGRPYFVMELVKGIPITDYCDRERLSIRERLELFVLVCRAVQHAHQKGIIHRDLKPSNVLVTLIDGAAVPKVIDFGVAKATGTSLTEMTLFTGFQQLIGTPLYMSPEQAALSGVDVDTRSDIYSLGVLLYEFLTGSTPFDREAFRTAAFDEMRRIIREEDPPKPSTRLSSLGSTISAVSSSRCSAPKHLRSAVRGELDWVVMRALEKDRRRRYETANDFAADVMRYLNDQPVDACPATARYRFSKYARRNRAALSSAALLGLALVSGIAASTWQAVKATAAEKRAVAAQELAEDHLEFGLQAVDDLYDQVANRWLASARWGVPLPRPFLEKALPFYEKFVEGRRVNPTMGRAQNRIGEILIQLRRFQEAEKSLDRSEAIWLALLAVDPENPEHIQSLGKCYANQSELPHVWERRRPILEKAISQRVRLTDRFPAVVSYWKELAGSHGAMAVWSRHTGGAQKHLDRQREITERLSAANPSDPDLKSDLGTINRAYSEVYGSTQRWTDAEPYSRRALAIHDELHTMYPTLPRYLQHLAWDLVNLGFVLNNACKYDEAARASSRSALIFEGLAREYPESASLRSSHVAALTIKAIGLIMTNNRALAEQAITQLEGRGNAEETSARLAEICWHLVQRDVPRVTEPAYAVELASRALALGPESVPAWHAMGMARYRARQWEEAISALTKVNELEHDEGLAFNGFFLAMAFHQQGDPERAHSWYDRSVRWLADHNVKDPNAVRYRDEATMLLGVKNPELEAKPKKLP